MNEDTVYEAFVADRKQLLEQSRLSREALDAWIENHRTLEASLPEIARLEFLLEERKHDLAQLIALDERLMDHVLIKRRELKKG